MKRYLLPLLFCALTAQLHAADNAIAGPKYNSGNENQVPWRSTDDGGFQVQHVKVNGIIAGESHIGSVGGHNETVSASFTRPADTTAYASGDLVANSTTAGSVVPMSLALNRAGAAADAGGMIRRLRLRKTGTSVTNASFRVHFYRTSPTPSNGDNGAWLTNNNANYVGAIDVTMDRVFTDGASGNGVPNIGSEINFTSATYYALVEARGAYTPASGETFTVELEVLQN